MGRKKNRVVKTVLDFSDIESFNAVLGLLEDGQTYFRLGGRLLIEQMEMAITRDHLKPMLSKLRRYPPKRDPDKKVNWTSPKQRRYVMWLVSSGQLELPYKRTGALGRGWRGDVTLDFGAKNLLTVRIENVAKQRIGKDKGKPFAQYVMGNIGLGKSRRSQTRYNRPQQGFHQETGWSLAYEIIQPTVDEIEEAVAEYVDEWIVNGIEILATGQA